MKKKFRILLFFVSLTITISMVSNTYSKYVVDSSGDIDVGIKNWEIMINDNDIVQNTTSSINISPAFEVNNNVKENSLAPTSKGYFDVEIDPTDVGLSYNYVIELTTNSAEFQDILISKYEILDSKTSPSNPLNIIEINNGIIENTILYNETIDNFKHEKFIIRIYFEWYDESDNTLSDEDDVIQSENANAANNNLKVTANIKFKQVA